MKDLIQSLLEQLKSTNQQTRVVLLAGFLALIGAVTFSTWRAKNPHMEFFQSDLDATEFAAVTAALGKHGIRFDTSTGGAPYSIWVEGSAIHSARAAVATEGAMDVGTRGIATSGSSSAFDASMEREQKVNARFWQEVEKQLEVLSWVRAAKVTASMPTRTVLGRRPQPTVSVILTTRGTIRPTRQQARDVSSIVQHAFNVPSDHVTITDHHGVALADPEADQGLEGMLAFESGFESAETSRAQAWLDRTYGPGIAVVNVAGEWKYERVEEVGEVLDDKGKTLSEDTVNVVTPVPSAVGGPAGLAANTAPTPDPAAAPADPATRDETSKQLVFGSKTTHRVSTEPTLERLSVSLLLDESRAAELQAATATVKALVGFDEQRDTFSGQTTRLFGLERDEDGLPIAAAPVEVPAAPNPMVSMLIERALEVVAAVVFLFLLLRTLKKSRAADGKGGAVKPGELDLKQLEALQAEGADLSEIDPALLGRRTVENLIDQDPERVSALLSRWALGEDFYETAKS